MSFAVSPVFSRIAQLALFASLAALVSCSKTAPPADLKILGTPPATAFYGVEYLYDFGISGGNGIPTVSLSNAPNWLSAEYVDNASRKGVVIRGVPGITGGERGTADKGGDDISLNVYDGNAATSEKFTIEVKDNPMSIGDVTVTEGSTVEIPKDDNGNPLSDCVASQADVTLGAHDTAAYVPVTLAQPSVRTVKASFHTEVPSLAITDTALGTVADQDYVSYAGTLTFNPGVTLCYIRVVVRDDDVAEDSETINVKLDAITEGFASIDSQGARSAAVITIDDNEPQVSWSIAKAAVSEGKSVDVKVTLDHSSSIAVAAEFEVYSDPLKPDESTTAQPTDYSLTPNDFRVVFQPGETEKTVTIEALSDAPDSSAADEKLVLAWKRSATVRETKPKLNIFINEWVQPVVSLIGPQGQTRKMLSDQYSNVYVAYTGVDSSTGHSFGKVDIWNRFGTAIIQSITFAEGHTTFDHELRDIVIHEYDQGVGVGVNHFVDLYLVGSTVGNTEATSAGGKDVLLEKWQQVNNVGLFQKLWARQTGTAFDDEPNAAAIDGAGNVYVVGETLGTFGPGVNQGGKDAMMLKYDSSGALQFQNSGGTPGDDALLDAIGGGSSFNVVSATGYTNGDFFSSNSGGQDIILGSYSSDGEARRSIQYGNQTDNVGSRIAGLGADAIIQGGYTLGSLLLDEDSRGGEDAFVSYLHTANILDETIQFGGAGDDRVLDLIVDGNNVYASGSTTGAIASSETSNGGKDGFLAEFAVDTDKNAISQTWIKQIGTAADEQISAINMTVSRKLMVLTETQTGSGTQLTITPYNDNGEALAP